VLAGFTFASAEAVGIEMVTPKDIFDRTKKYLREVWSELSRVSWPQKKEIIASTAVVIICTFIVAFFLGIVDIALQKLLGYLIK
jgi:preprotein translocase subunit SecE